MAAAVAYSEQQKNLRAKATKGSVDTSKLEHFESFQVGAKTTFALLGEMAGKLYAVHRPEPNQTPGAAGPSKADYITVGEELFEELCAAIDIPHSVIGQCINVSDKQVIDSRPKKIKGGNQLKIDGAAVNPDLDKDMMGEEDDDANKANKTTAKAGKAVRAAMNRAGREEQDEEGEDAGPDTELTAEDLERIAAEEKKKREAEQAEQEALEAALEAEERKRLLQEENERKLKEQARKVTADVPIGMSVLKKEDDDDDMWGGGLGKGAGGKGGKKKGRR